MSTHTVETSIHSIDINLSFSPYTNTVKNFSESFFLIVLAWTIKKKVHWTVTFKLFITYMGRMVVQLILIHYITLHLFNWCFYSKRLTKVHSYIFIGKGAVWTDEFSFYDGRCVEFLLTWYQWGACSTIVEPGQTVVILMNDSWAPLLSYTLPHAYCYESWSLHNKWSLWKSAESLLVAPCETWKIVDLESYKHVWTFPPIKPGVCKYNCIQI